MAMGFYGNNAYLQGEKLYTEVELEFPSKGDHILWTHLVPVVFAALGFMLILWLR
jgi:hypothetical protein